MFNINKKEEIVLASKFNSPCGDCKLQHLCMYKDSIKILQYNTEMFDITISCKDKIPMDSIEEVNTEMVEEEKKVTRARKIAQ